MQREKLAERGEGGRGAAPPPQAVKAGSACFVPAEPERAAPAAPAKAAEGQGEPLWGRAAACGGQVQGAGRAAGRPGGAGAGRLRPPKPSSGRFGLRPPANLPPAKNPPTAVGGFRYLFQDYSSAGASSSTGSSSGASSASSALMDRLAR